jgi:hypothetical protein
VVNTHIPSFFHRLSSYIIRTNKKLGDEECVCVHTHIKKKKEERIYTRIENGSSSMGLKKTRGGGDRGRDRASKQVVDR